MKCSICGKELGTGDNCELGVCYNCERESFLKQLNNKAYYYLPPKFPKRVLLVEDGSVDTEKLDLFGIDYIVYRQGSNAPYWIEIKGE